MAMRLRVYGDIKGASWCGTADLDERELGDGEGRWALRLGGPCLLLVLLPALVLMVDKLQVVLHQVHVFREVALIQPGDRENVFFYFIEFFVANIANIAAVITVLMTVLQNL